MQGLSTSFVFGYHGCDAVVAEALLKGEPFKPSENDYDWLGKGIYFWEANPLRGMEYAKEISERAYLTRGDVKDPAVVGAVIDLGHCLDLMSTNGLNAVRLIFGLFQSDLIAQGGTLPKNKGGKDKLLRHLDCAVINHLHAFREAQKLSAFDSVRGVFMEDDPIYPGSSFHGKTHIQIAVTNPSCIKAVFRVPKEQLQDGTA